MPKGYTLSRLQGAVRDYLTAHPKAQHPLDYLQLMGVQPLTDVIEGSKGREVVFTTDKEKLYKGVSYKYKSAKG